MPQQDPITQAGRAWQPAQLVVLAPDTYRGRCIQVLKDELVVGREAHCDVRFDDPYLSRAHAVLRRRGGTVYVQDLNSKAGTLVNGAAASADRPLRPGDIVALADVQLRFESAGAGPPEPMLADDTMPDQDVAYVERREGFLRRLRRRVRRPAG